ncbi:MAG: ABC transporter substrate-binding protein [Muribaculaceae bacterium]|nr:ABC transporter substrate-binding protein [Muribaculaceae bacterium]
MTFLRNILTIVLSAIFLVACNSGSTTSREVVGDTLTTHAKLLTIVDCGGYTLVDVQNPWKEGALLKRYALVHRDSVKPEGLTTEIEVVRVPINSALVYSSVHAGAFNELGRVDAVTGIVDAEYYKISQIVEGVRNGTVVDAGNSMAPTIEKIVELSPDVILTSPFQNAGHGAIEKLGITIIECADYMETTPLGRAEWIKFFGFLLCKEKEANAIYEDVVNSYSNLCAKVKEVENRPTVISEMLIDGVWFLPGGGSYMAQMYADAGAAYPWSEDSSTGSLQLDFATVYDKAYNADFWIIKSHEPNFTLANLESKYPLNKKFEAFSKGGVYVIKTVETSFFEDFPFHPEKLLKEYIQLFHPEIFDGEQVFKYLQQVK